MITLIDAALLDEVCAEARDTPRRRKNRNFHPHNDYPAHRLLNAMQTDSYIQPHRHLDPHKDETFVVLRGLLGLLIFNDAGEITRVAKVGAGATAQAQGVDIPHGVWHCAVGLQADTVFLEAKSGPYQALCDAEKAPWAPAENSPEVAAYLASLKSRLTSMMDRPQRPAE